MLQISLSLLYLNNKGTQDNTTEDWVVEDAFKDIPFTVDLTGIDLIEKLHHYKGIEDNGVVFWGWGMEGCIPATVNVQQFLSYRGGKKYIPVKKKKILDNSAGYREHLQTQNPYQQRAM